MPTRRASQPDATDQRSGGLTVDELARAARTTTRQVRALQTRGLLPPPVLVGRTGYYDTAHLDRLRAILRLQRDGFSLAALRSLLGAWDAKGSLGDVLGLHLDADPAAQPVVPEEPDVFGDAALALVLSAPRRGRLLSLVPTTILEQPAAS